MAERGGPQFRSVLFAPPQRMEWLLEGHGADAVMFDLEDMVPIADKASARVATAEALDSMADRPVGRFVRTNAWATGHLIKDMDAIVRPGLDVVALPKTESPDQVRALDLLLTELEQERGMPVGAIEILPLAETAAGMFFTYELAAASPRVKRLYGVMNATREGDGARSLRLELGRDGDEWVPIGAHILLGARSAGVQHILGATPMEPDNVERARALSMKSRVYGANGALCIHPQLVPIVNEVYSPAQSDIDHAVEVLHALAAAVESGESTTVVDGELATYSHARSALDTLALARRFGIPVADVPDIDLLNYSA